MKDKYYYQFSGGQLNRFTVEPNRFAENPRGEQGWATCSLFIGGNDNALSDTDLPYTDAYNTKAYILSQVYHVPDYEIAQAFRDGKIDGFHYDHDAGTQTWKLEGPGVSEVYAKPFDATVKMIDLMNCRDIETVTGGRVLIQPIAYRDGEITVTDDLKSRTDEYPDGSGFIWTTQESLVQANGLDPLSMSQTDMIIAFAQQAGMELDAYNEYIHGMYAIYRDTYDPMLGEVSDPSAWQETRYRSVGYDLASEKEAIETYYGKVTEQMPDVADRLREEAEKNGLGTVFASQAAALTVDYEEGLRDFLELVTGIDRDNIYVQNIEIEDDRGSGSPVRNAIRVRFDIGTQEGLPESAYRQEFLYDSMGNSHSGYDGAPIDYAVQYYTTMVYKQPKEELKDPLQTPLSPFPTVKMAQAFIDRAREKVATFRHMDMSYTGRMYDRYLVFSRGKDGKEHLFMNNKEIDLGKGAAELRRTFREDITDKAQERMDAVTKQLHDITRETVPLEAQAAYDYEKLDRVFESELRRLTAEHTGGEAEIDFHGYHISARFGDAPGKIDRIELESTAIYDSSQGSMNLREAARELSYQIAPLLERDGMFLGLSPEEQSKWDGISELDEDGQLQGQHYDNARGHLDPGLDIAIEEAIEYGDVR